MLSSIYIGQVDDSGHTPDVPTFGENDQIENDQDDG